MTRKQAVSMMWGGLAVALAVAVLATTAFGAPKLKIGDAAPTWSGLTGVDDKQHALPDYEKAKLVVVVFTCNHCPVAVAYQDRLIGLQKDYESKGVQVVAINSNSPKKQPPDSFDKMKERAKDKGFNFPYLFDESQNVAKDYGATCTPHVFVVDKDRKIAYMGAIDDSMRAEKVKEPYLRSALDALLEGKKPPKAVTQQVGCSIKWED
jgi:peroxiredoxin